MTLGRQVLVGIDDSPESIEAARQAAALTASDGALTLLAAWQVKHGDRTAPRRHAEDAVARARRALIGHVGGTEVVDGNAAATLLREARRGRATLLAVGARGGGRLKGILVGATATEIAHRSPCTVLIARPAGAWFPRSVVVGVDGSPESATAHAVACEIAHRRGAALRVIAARGDGRLNRLRVGAVAGDTYEAVRGDAVGALVAASAEADLVVVGSRGLTGARALGSVSERVAHKCGCSVLIVRSVCSL